MLERWTTWGHAKLSFPWARKVGSHGGKKHECSSLIQGESGTSFPDVTVLCYPSGAFKKHRCLRPIPKDADLIVLEHSLGLGVSIKLPRRAYTVKIKATKLKGTQARASHSDHLGFVKMKSLITPAVGSNHQHLQEALRWY